MIEKKYMVKKYIFLCFCIHSWNLKLLFSPWGKTGDGNNMRGQEKLFFSGKRKSFASKRQVSRGNAKFCEQSIEILFFLYFFHYLLSLYKTEQHEHSPKYLLLCSAEKNQTSLKQHRGTFNELSLLFSFISSSGLVFRGLSL